MTCLPGMGAAPTPTCRVRDDNPNQVIERKLLAVHDSKHDHFPLPFSEESDGTQQLLHFLPVLSPAEQSKVFVIDELDRSLHPRLLGVRRLFQRVAPRRPQTINCNDA